MYKGKQNRSDAPARQKKASDKFRSVKAEYSEKPRKASSRAERARTGDAASFRRDNDESAPYRRGAKTERKPYNTERGASQGKYSYKKRVSKPLAAPKPQSDEVRLNKFIANSGVCSRREADTYIQTGLVTVNGKIVTELGTKVKPGDDVRFNGERLKGEQKVYLVMNKPKNYVTTMSDPHAEQTVMDLITKEKCPQRVFPVGRLDKATTGVLLFTNDGPLAEKLMHPSFETRKIYQVDLDKNLKGSDFNAILEGIKLEDGEIHADSLSYIDDDRSKVGIEIHSGRNRIVRRIFEHLGYKVRKLDRVYFAGLTKKNLKRGQWRFLSAEEVNFLMMGGDR